MHTGIVQQKFGDFPVYVSNLDKINIFVYDETSHVPHTVSNTVEFGYRGSEHFQK